MLNHVSTVRWNADKQYLLDMERQGVRIVPTHWLPRGTSFQAEQVFEALNTDRLVLKPAVSGGAKNTFDLDLAEAQRRTSELTTLLLTEDFLAQPFLPQIQSQGEWSLIYLGGRYSHCVLKTPRSGDFRVQHYLGGIGPREAPAPLRHTADDIVQRFAANCLYARVDVVETDGEFLLMALELIEPFLYLDTAENSFARYAAGMTALTKHFEL